MNKHNDEILKIRDKTAVELINEKRDKYPCLKCRKFFLK